MQASLLSGFPRRPTAVATPPLPVLLISLLALSTLGGQSALAAPAAPDAGAILQQVNPPQPAAPSSVAAPLSIEREGAAVLPPSAPFEVKRIEVSGNTLFDAATLHALVSDGEGQSLTLIQVGELASRITAHYRSQGYPLARAFIPAQTIREGAVRIEVLEARYGKVQLDNRSQVSDALLAATLQPLQSADFIAQTTMERSLLLLSDIPGAQVNAVLKPGEATGTSDLLVGAAPGPGVSGQVTLDNSGNRYTGRARISATANVLNPLHHGDVLSVTGLSSGEGLNYGRVSYESLINGQGTRLGGSYSALRYTLGDQLASLDANGTAKVTSLWAKHPFVRSQEVNLYGTLQYDGTQLRDHIESSALYTDRSLKSWTASLSGDARDAFLLGGVTAWRLGVTAGDVGFDDAQAQSSDAATANTQGGFSKWNANLTRLQGLGSKDSLYLAYTGQWANDNLDPAQKMTAGGPYTVRAYDAGALSGDSGHLISAEWRHDLGAAWQGQWQTVAFIDSAQIRVNKAPWATGVNSASLSGAGVGLNWLGAKRWNARLSIATRIGSVPKLLASGASTRGWIEIGASF
ncbi:ShlB/FhaC/HecB family hemolysin secretion/activation protein [Hydrogenophaga sp. PAMC20947]|uniref:ShlB/FhaC/HecB family hemolysin secretion/activation protein n=1 Tax=Hydrogenophaga sp. PAMC20947 TaxID=2565558 RepID=UPI00109DE637|nr:ShlB/FhaC/HecB family hemolysin secretion/activation protein [Hydrogenophaga sp. PAMC20947]QCB44908.1 ShlB/FhaC/HecB family hemolysin secretion/activation protein [Hydrogenophaga sp. PAMC20947]